VKLFETRISASIVAAQAIQAKTPPQTTAPAPPAPPKQSEPARSQNVIDLRPGKGLGSTATSGLAATSPPLSRGLINLAQRLVAATLKGKERMGKPPLQPIDTEDTQNESADSILARQLALDTPQPTHH
jgi:hypothetical protein